jgi:hydrogenase maturation factor
VSANGEHCITCSDTAVLATVIRVSGATATVDVDGGEANVGIELVEGVAPGDVLVCHAGIALEKATADA